MKNNRLETFTNRHEAIALFEYLRKNAPNKPRPLLPILTFVAPDGGGKNALIEYLRRRKCCLPDGRVILPHVYLDFGRIDAPRDLLSILVALRNHLQAQGDEQGRNLTFPSFDLGAVVALATPRDGELPFFSISDIERKLVGAWPYFESLNERGYALGNSIPIIPPLLAGLKSGTSTPALQELLYRLEYSSGWHWYRLHGSEMGLAADATVNDVLLRLHALSRPGKAEKLGREYLVQSVLSAAFLADLRENLNSSHDPSVWNETTNVVLFLDGFDTLLSDSDSSSIGLRLLEMLALSEHRKRGGTDPLLLVISCRASPMTFTNIPGSSVRADVSRSSPSPSVAEVQRERLSIPSSSSALYEHWRQQLPDNRQSKGESCTYSLRDLFLPLELSNFGLDDTAEYLLKLGEQRQTSAFTVTGFVSAMHDFTQGHPLYLALAAACVLEAEAHTRGLEPTDFSSFEDEDVSRAEYLCSLYLDQLSRQEADHLIFCAVPRMLDRETLQIILQLPNDGAIQQQWDTYRNLPFVRAIDEDHIVFHPIVRRSLLQRLPPDASVEGNYHRIHTRLREHFHRRSTMVTSGQAKANSGIVRSTRMKGNEYARIEEAYHALALGDSEPAIDLALFAQRARLALWEPLLDAITEAPAALLPTHVGRKAADALAMAMQHQRIQDIVVAIVLFTWLLTASQEERRKTAEIQNSLGAAYWTLASGDRQVNLEKAIACYQAALRVYTRDGFPMDWATTQNNLGAAYWTLASIDRQERQANLEKAIACSKAALQVYSRNAFPADWARTQFNLGRAYNDLLDEDRQENLERAIACFHASLSVYTRKDFPVVWAKTYDSLGNAYLNLPGGNRQENLLKAIASFRAALEIYTQQKFPIAWARVQHRLGDAYRDLTDNDLQRGNLLKAIAFYEAALRVYTWNSFPTEWAEAHDSLGYTYASLPSTYAQDLQENLKQAIAHYQAALQVYTRDAFPSNWASTQNNLGYAYAFLPGAGPHDQRESLKKAIACYEGALQVFTTLQFDDYIELVSNNLADAQERLPWLW